MYFVQLPVHTPSTIQHSTVHVIINRSGVLQYVTDTSTQIKYNT